MQHVPRHGPRGRILRGDNRLDVDQVQSSSVIFSVVFGTLHSKHSIQGIGLGRLVSRTCEIARWCTVPNAVVKAGVMPMVFLLSHVEDSKYRIQGSTTIDPCRHK